MPWMRWSWGLLPPLQRLDWVINVPTYALACCSEFTGTLFNAPKKHQVNIKSYAKRWQKQHEGKLPQNRWVRSQHRPRGAQACTGNGARGQEGADPSTHAWKKGPGLGDTSGTSSGFWVFWFGFLLFLFCFV